MTCVECLKFYSVEELRQLLKSGNPPGPNCAGCGAINDRYLSNIQTPLEYIEQTGVTTDCPDAEKL